MNRITQIFKDNKAFIAFLTAGDPTLAKTEKYILAMDAAGADLIEIGIPFSDPVAEGEVIQRANQRALFQGTTTDHIFTMVKNIRTKTTIPLVFLTYINPIFTYGSEKFLANCAACGIDGLIIPDLPFEERAPLHNLAKAYGITIISLIAPTSTDRIHKIAKAAEGFIYCVSSLGVTGVRSEIKTDLKAIIDTIHQTTTLPIAVGFGISTPSQATLIKKYADGIIVGSAIVKIIEQHKENATTPLTDYIKTMKAALD